MSLNASGNDKLLFGGGSLHPSNPNLLTIKESIEARVPFDTAENATKLKMLEEINRYRELDSGQTDAKDEVDLFDDNSIHFTASGVMISSRGVLLHRHKRLHCWMLPGGHIDPGELPCETARREGLEETGVTSLHPENVPILVHLDIFRSAAEHTHMDLRYLLIASAMDPSPPPDESQDVLWLSFEEALTWVDDRLIAALRSALEHPSTRQTLSDV